MGLNSDSFFLLSKKEQSTFLNSLNNNPNDLSCLSINQYKCQVFLMNKCFVILLNFISIIVLPIYIVIKRYKKCEFCCKYDAVFITDGIPLKTLPSSLLSKYKNIICINFANQMSLKNTDIDYIKGLLKGKKYSPYFLLKLYIKLSMYSNIVYKYHPRAIISYSESSFTSQIITGWLENQGIKHINIMHGEKLFLLLIVFLILVNIMCGKNIIKS